jgi:hypothetical protein
VALRLRAALAGRLLAHRIGWLPSSAAFYRTE